MSSERDIEDILESLNELLREGESHNDDRSGKKARQEKAPLPKDEKKDEKVAVKKAVRPEVVKPTPEKPASFKAETAGHIPPVADEQKQDESEPDEPMSSDDAPVSMNRVVLTEDMMVNNPQGSLLTLVKNASGLKKQHLSREGGGKQDLKNASVHVDHGHLEQLIRQISDDLIKRLEKELPALIAESLYRHLKELKRDE